MKSESETCEESSTIYECYTISRDQVRTFFNLTPKMLDSQEMLTPPPKKFDLKKSSFLISYSFWVNISVHAKIQNPR